MWTALDYSFHEGQGRAWESTKPIVAIVAGARSGKTSYGPLFLHREMLRQGPGDYLVAAPTFEIIDEAAAPAIDAFFSRMLGAGHLNRSPPMRFYFSEQGFAKIWPGRPFEPCRIIFGHAQNPDSLEAMRAKAAWLDEAGQPAFRESSFEAVQRRVSIDQGRILITTTPYQLGWLYKRIWQPWLASGRNHPEIDVITFASTMNPIYPLEEFEKAKRTMPRWRFAMFHLGIFTRPAGQIYDCFDAERHVVPRFKVPDAWRRYAGLDFGAVNTAAVMLAEEQTAQNHPTGRYIAYREYHPATRMTPEEHAAEIRAGEPHLPHCVGGAHNEQEWRDKFSRAGLGVAEPPIANVEPGIDAVYSLLKEGKLIIFEDLTNLIEELSSYSRIVDDLGQVTEKVDDPHSFHMADALRYLATLLIRNTGMKVEASQKARSSMADWLDQERRGR